MANLDLKIQMSDGQTVTIIFYNPDSTPNKLLPNDTLTSWKWILNNRDVTAVLQPETGKDVNIPALASRIMQLVEKNHNRFVRNKAKLEKENAKLADLTETVTQKENIIAELDKEIAEWQAKVDELVANPVSVADEPQDEPIVLTGKEFGEFDISSNEGQKAYIGKVAEYLDTLNEKRVYNASLQADIVIGRNAIDKSLFYNGLNKSPVKMQAMAKILEILKQAKVFKPSKESYDEQEQRNKMVYHYLKTPFFVDGVEYGARIVVRQDKENDKYYYDFQVKDNVNVIFDSLQKNSLEEFPLTHSGLVQGYENHSSTADNKSQALFDELRTANAVLNLFIFDENGNEIDDLVQDEPQQPVENLQNNDIDDNQGTSEPKNNTDKLKGEPKYEYRPHGKDLTFLGQEFDHTPTGDNYTVWGVAKGGERWGVSIAVETVNMGKKITTKELAQKVADVMAQRFGYTQLEIRSDRAFLGGGVSAISNAFGAGGLTKPAQENKNQDTQAELTKQMNEPNETDPNLDYLTDMANGKIELTVQNMKEHILKLKEIAIALDGKHDDLLNQAIEVYQQFALSVKVQ